MIILENGWESQTRFWADAVLQAQRFRFLGPINEGNPAAALRRQKRPSGAICTITSVRQWVHDGRCSRGLGMQLMTRGAN